MSSANSSLIGSVIADRYEVLGSLGAGQHGEVWRVHDSNLDADYALKLLGPQQVSGPWAEARLLNTLSGDFILPIRNADTTPEGTRYLVTDIAEHGTVMDRIDPTLGVPEEQAVGWVREACNGLARVHRHGLLHRDIKPENLFLTESGKCLIGDLSLAGEQDAMGCVQAGGTLATMAPEVGAVGVTGYMGIREVYSVQSEVFSLGASLYWMLTGRAPISGSNFRDAAAATPIDLWEIAPHVSRAVRDITMRCLERGPAQRYSGPAALTAALGRRNKPARHWVRVANHSDHERCLEGVKSGKSLSLCVVPGPRTGFVFQVHYTDSGRRHGQDGRRTAAADLTAGLNQSIRSCIRAID